MGQYANSRTLLRVCHHQRYIQTNNPQAVLSEPSISVSCMVGLVDGNVANGRRFIFYPLFLASIMDGYFHLYLIKQMQETADRALKALTKLRSESKNYAKSFAVSD